MQRVYKAQSTRKRTLMCRKCANICAEICTDVHMNMLDVHMNIMDVYIMLDVYRNMSFDEN